MKQIIIIICVLSGCSGKSSRHSNSSLQNESVLEKVCLDSKFQLSRNETRFVLKFKKEMFSKNYPYVMISGYKNVRLSTDGYTIYNYYDALPDVQSYRKHKRWKENDGCICFRSGYDSLVVSEYHLSDSVEFKLRLCYPATYIVENIDSVRFGIKFYNALRKDTFVEVAFSTKKIMW